MNALATNDSSVAYQIALNHATKRGIPADHVRPHTLKMYAALDPKKNSYEFKTQQTESAIFKDTEKRLLTSDAMIAQSLGFALHKVITVANASGQLSGQPGNTRTYPYPDPAVFSGGVPVGAVCTEAEALMSIFNSKLKVQTDKEIVVEDYDMMNFLNVPQTQKGVSTDASLPGIVTRNWGKPFKFAGDTVNSFTLLLSEADITAIAGNIPAAGNTGDMNYLVLIIQGFIIKDGSKAMRAFPLSR